MQLQQPLSLKVTGKATHVLRHESKPAGGVPTQSTQPPYGAGTHSQVTLLSVEPASQQGVPGQVGHVAAQAQSIQTPAKQYCVGEQ